MAFDTAVKTLTEVGASEPLAVAVVDFARQAGTDAAGELVTRADFKEREASQPRSARFDGGDQQLGIVPCVVELREWQLPLFSTRSSMLRHVSHQAVGRVQCVQRADQVP